VIACVALVLASLWWSFTIISTCLFLWPEKIGDQYYDFVDPVSTEWAIARERESVALMIGAIGLGCLHVVAAVLLWRRAWRAWPTRVFAALYVAAALYLTVKGIRSPSWTELLIYPVLFVAFALLLLNGTRRNRLHPAT
jgi:hypothetical protein